MISRATEGFWKAYAGLPQTVKQRARSSYRLWRDNPNHPGLRFKKIHRTEPIFSVRIGSGWRAVGVLHESTMIWYWIGSHADYDTLVSQFHRKA